jgi:hypothetical protein
MCTMCSYGGVTASGLLLLPQLSGSRDSSVGIATGLWAGRLRCRSFESRCDQEFSVVHIVQTGSGAHPASCAVGTGGALCPGVKQ